ncbi:hypothetical protein LIER_08091 [Lithospermum erythrorhizon]|uniref:DUF4283 domain-containing protein n=1 Tax=Lithospermum erythrorhizon TaxID=34254 RepID=A0AAV3PEZ6_LITER
MDSEIIRNLLKCNLTDEESRPIQLEEEDLADGISECEVSAFAKVLSLKDGSISIQNFTLTMAKAWNCKGLRVSRVVQSILHIFFPLLEEKKRIMGGRPWCFDNQLVLIKDWGRNIDPLQIDFSECWFWIHLCGLTDEFFTKDVAFKLAYVFYGCEGVKLRKDKMGKKFFRIRATVVVERPIRHCVKQCPTLTEGSDPRRNMNYELWIKAPTERSWTLFKLMEDREANEDTKYLGGATSRFKVSKDGAVGLGDQETPSYPPDFGLLHLGSDQSGGIKGLEMATT